MKQETLEEAAEKLYSDKLYPMYGGLRRDAFINGAKWQQEGSYSQEDLEVAFIEGRESSWSFNDWFIQFKKK